MTDSTPNLWLLMLGFFAATVVVVGFVWRQMRRDRKEFSVLRVLAVALAAALGSLPFVAVWWWLPSQYKEAQRWLLLAAKFVPILALAVWGNILGIRQVREGKASPTAVAELGRPG